MIAALILSTLVVIVPHGDDEITVLPEIQAADNPIVVIMTDGAATSRCGNVSYDDCERRRRDSTTAFLAEAAPHARLLWIGAPDGKLNPRLVQLVATNVCDYCDVLAAGADYGHPDHDAVREGVAAIGGWAYDGALRRDDEAFRLMQKHYGWLVSRGQYEILGLIR